MTGWWIAAIVLGGVGAVVRVTATRLLKLRVPGGAPTATAAINIAGACAMGVVAAAGSTTALLVLGGGLLGGLTTFSTWMVEIDRTRGVRAAALLLVLPVVLGAAAFAVGRALG